MASKIKRLLGLCLAFVGAASINVAPGFQLIAPALSAAPVTAQMIADHFSSVKSMSGDFVQSGPKGEQTGGNFFLQRPGKIRFNYTGRSSVNVIADGKSLVIYNKKLKTSRLYSLSKTPLKLLLDNQVDFSGNRFRGMKEEGDLIAIRLADKSSFGNSKIAMMFDRRSFELRRWTITDEQGLSTTVTIFNVKHGVHFTEGTFTIDYSANREFNTTTKAR
ncbi:outer-membrane lipoprotein carrier protein LolA [Mesorhizobium kowhaii]|jgi:outer membrane lipoprotein-sorting protein|uniref:Outer membrane lipoprotein carrier protein LolA n=1 Tax=Mesorhizobium kowhaii TaxID=1300272 RepID=A0A2W7CJM2_9HYPH|nr:outer membrane lipoprotein carrier protein LolA [Mesorhizobium kowhaii]PZV36733.1 hypothetical protein B5V02_20175 [Mesorhizobium kowhaii]